MRGLTSAALRCGLHGSVTCGRLCCKSQNGCLFRNAWVLTVTASHAFPSQRDRQFAASTDGLHIFSLGR